jgi:hypothetical protein
MVFLRAAVVSGFLASGFMASLAQADTLRLRDGTVIFGNYVGGSQTEIWFQRSPAGAEAFPLFAVESVRFGNLIGSSAPNVPAPSVLKVSSTQLMHRRVRPAIARTSPRPVTLAALLHIEGTQPMYLSRVISARLSP